MKAEIMRTCTLTCQPGSTVEITAAQFRALENAARELTDNPETTLLEKPDAPENAETMTEVPEESGSADAPENVEKPVENVENAPEIPEAALAPETPEKKSGRRTKKG